MADPGGSTPGLVYGQVPTAAEWNSYFQAKQDWSAILQAIVDGGGVPAAQSFERHAGPSTGFAITPAPTAPTHRVVVVPGMTLASGTFIFPVAAADGQVILFSCTQGVTALTVSPGSGQAVVGMPTYFPKDWSFGAIFVEADLTWYPTS